MISNGQRHKKGEAEGKHPPKERVQRPMWQTPPDRVANVFTWLCYNRVLSGQEEVGLFVVFVFGDMDVLDKHPPLSHILDPKGVHLPDIAGNQEVVLVITQDRTKK